jgi:hypothetical protein
MSVIIFARFVAHYRRLFNELFPMAEPGVVLLVELGLGYLTLPFQAIK